MPLRSVLVTSEVTFVGKNYHGCVLPLATDPSIIALVIIKNRNLKLVALGLIALISGAAPRFGFQLFWNTIFPGTSKKVKTFKLHGKEVFFTNDLNSPESLSFLRSLTPDLLINARSRCIFRNDLLAVPRLGSINIHHGLLPDQRGVMCDFWAHMYGQSFGFSIHEMTSKIDAGRILKVVKTTTPPKDYLKSIYEGSLKEPDALIEVLRSIQERGSIFGEENIKSDETKYFKNPRLMDFYRLRLKGIKV